MKRITALALTALIACHLSAHAADWEYKRTTDKMTDQTTTLARIKSSNSLSLDRPYEGENHGTILVRQHPELGLDILVGLDKGLLQCGFDDCAIRLRLDGAKPVSWQFAPAADGSSGILFARNPRKLLPQLIKAKTVMIELPVFQEGRQLIEFTIDKPLVWDAPTTKKKK